MPNENRVDPVHFYGVMVSSTFTDLAEHRTALINAINAQDLKAVVMENSSAKPIDVLDASLEMVRKAAAYIGVIGHQYGQIPEDKNRNPESLSLTELEFNEARELGRPILIFMTPNHPVRTADVEIDPVKRKKLHAFREKAKHMSAGSSVHRVYKVFHSLGDFEVSANQATAELFRYLTQPGFLSLPDEIREFIPSPPELYAEPPYIGSHKFIGREAQLATLNGWAAAADPHPLLLFDAIGGAGKSILTWEWTTKHAATARTDWAGRFWYSFYEKGAVMADFCRRALAYMTRRTTEDFSRKKTAELSGWLLQQLRARPWLVVLDGLERVLVAYHRIDAAQVADENAGKSDGIASRDPRAAINPEDDELLRALSSAVPSKLLITSRLIPQTLLNRSGQAIPGVRHERLPGLLPADAENLLRSCSITGTSEDIQNYLRIHCDCHPLVAGVLAGLINDYLPDRGNFDAWVGDPGGGAALNLAELDLAQKRNHILRAALTAVPQHGRQLLSTLALLSEAVDYPTLSAINPCLPSRPTLKAVPPSEWWDWAELPQKEKTDALHEYQAVLTNHEQEVAQWHRLCHDAEPQLAGAVRDLERRGLLQYDLQARRYDLHPVVRAIAVGDLVQEERTNYGQRVVDHFSQRSRSAYEQAETLDDVKHGLQVVRTLLQMSRYREAARAYIRDLANVLSANLESYSTVVSLLRPFFPNGWGNSPIAIGSLASSITNAAAIALDAIGEHDEALAAFSGGLRANLAARSWIAAGTKIGNIGTAMLSRNRLAAAERCLRFSYDIAVLVNDSDSVFSARLDLFNLFAMTGRRSDAEKMWNLLDPMGREWDPAAYRAGVAEFLFAWFHLCEGDLREKHLTAAETLAIRGKDRETIRRLHEVRGEWQLERKQWALAAESLQEAARMARETGQISPSAEALLALANLHLGRLPDARQEAERLASAKHVSHLDIAALWLAIDDKEQATKHAVEAYHWAWADGEPYVHRYYLRKARALLEQLAVEIPALSPYDPAKDKKLPCEDEVAVAIKELRKEKWRNA